MRISNRTQVNPLILNFMTPATPETESASTTPMYDSINEITWFMGGGNGGSKKATRCEDKPKLTTIDSSHSRFDSERYTDD